MKTKSSTRRTAWLETDPQLVSEVLEPVSPKLPFHTSLRDCAKSSVKLPASSRRVNLNFNHQERTQHSNRRARKPRRVTPSILERITRWLNKWQRPVTKHLHTAHTASLSDERLAQERTNIAKMPEIAMLKQIWSWIQARYSASTTKRLRVAEVASLGDKRFVALVTVEGREFLIGGGASGVSLLTPLEMSAGSVSPLQLMRSDGGDS